MYPVRPTKPISLFENNNSNCIPPIWSQNFTSFHPIFPLLSQTSSLFAERTTSKNIPSLLPSVSSLPSFLPTDPFMSTVTPFSVTLIRGDKLETINLRLQLTSNENVIEDILSTREHCDNVVLLCFSRAGQYFHVVFCSAPDGLNIGDQFNMPAKWQSLCKEANIKKANIRNGIVIRNIEFGEEIIICNEVEALLLEPSKMLQNDKQGQQLEMKQQKLNETG
ncbi:unnamed protein product [Onchocerca flexuosa]|uniref:Uncharacterized protein n=1 Tax=Onchocerca flexuosa TaxID=387005 RepID=A0A183I6R2_9BILA|nr:unnamed protein product [Onchocerca flexuosa]